MTVAAEPQQQAQPEPWPAFCRVCQGPCYAAAYLVAAKNAGSEGDDLARTFGISYAHALGRRTLNGGWEK